MRFVMNNFGLVRLLGFAAAFSFASFQLAVPAASKPVRYTLLSDSQFIKDCLICAIPTMFFPLRGTFDLIETDVGHSSRVTGSRTSRSEQASARTAIT